MFDLIILIVWFSSYVGGCVGESGVCLFGCDRDGNGEDGYKEWEWVVFMMGWNGDGEDEV